MNIWLCEGMFQVGNVFQAFRPKAFRPKVIWIDEELAGGTGSQANFDRTQFFVFAGWGSSFYSENNFGKLRSICHVQRNHHISSSWQDDLWTRSFHWATLRMCLQSFVQKVRKTGHWQVGDNTDVLHDSVIVIKLILTQLITFAEPMPRPGRQFWSTLPLQM